MNTLNSFRLLIKGLLNAVECVWFFFGGRGDWMQGTLFKDFIFSMKSVKSMHKFPSATHE